MKRYIEYDIVRTIVLILMPIAHIVEIFSYYKISSTQSMQLLIPFDVIAGLGAAAFMICMGVNINLSKNNDPGKLIKRGIVLLAAGIGLNLIRYILPAVIVRLLFNDYLVIGTALYSSVASDILYFAALYMIFLGIMNSLKIKPIMIALITVLMSIADSFIPNPHFPDNQLIQGLVGNFVYIDRYSSFAFLQWAIIPTIGYVFGYYWKRAELKGEDDSFWNKTAISSAAIILILSTVCFIFKINILDIAGNQHETYNMNLIGATMISAAALQIIYLMHKITPLIHRVWICNFFIDVSKSITIYYVLQWVLVTYLAAIFYSLGFDGKAKSLSAFSDILIYAFITCICIFTSLMIQKKRKRAQLHEN